MKSQKVPPTAVSRLPLYLRCLTEAQQQGTEILSSKELAELAGGNAAQVRKDLSYLGEFGIRGIGYEVDGLIRHISRWLGLTRQHNAAIVGMGRLGPALQGYQGFIEKGFKVVAVFDQDPAKVGASFDGVAVQHISELEDTVRARQIEIAIVTTPSQSAQEIADKLVSAGIRAILNFAPVHLEVPPHVNCRQVDLSVELQILCFHLERQRE
ncbi:MAG: redox-sensing transcriptional repressor Rex [Actinobacteria bacterium]|nr:MAG: redox-sensing transcriptional repressor Rex [Actinomycetota bacterium]